MFKLVQDLQPKGAILFEKKSQYVCVVVVVLKEGKTCTFLLPIFLDIQIVCIILFLDPFLYSTYAYKAETRNPILAQN